MQPARAQAPGVSNEYRDDWHHASAYVAKEYKDAAVGTRDTFERDCKVRASAQPAVCRHSAPADTSPPQMQQDAKLWGARYDALRPPKPVDFLQCFLLELVEREGRPIFACECVTLLLRCCAGCG